MSEPEDNADIGFASPWGPQFAQQFGPWTPQPQTLASFAHLAGVALPIVGVAPTYVTIRSDSLQYGVSETQFPVSLLPSGVTPIPGMLFQFNTDGTVYLLSGSDEDQPFTGWTTARRTAERLRQLREEFGLLQPKAAEAVSIAVEAAADPKPEGGRAEKVLAAQAIFLRAIQPQTRVATDKVAVVERAFKRAFKDILATARAADRAVEIWRADKERRHRELAEQERQAEERLARFNADRAAEEDEILEMISVALLDELL